MPRRDDHQLTMAVRDAIAAGLRVRRGAELNELLIFERANNIAVALCEQFNIRRRHEDDVPTPVDFSDPRIM